MIPLAHAGHWLIEALYVLPVVVVVLWISVKSVLDRRREAELATPAPEPAGPARDPQG